ncbi:MAG TPA: hypothetical protein VFV08_16360, partial [Puia sp.]|nr:hypothetical protein [Puia sp.]
MDNASQKIYPPLRIWIFLFVAILLITAVLFHFDHLQNQHEFDVRSTYVQQGFANAKGRPVILVIGTSLLECGLDSSRKIEECVGEMSGKSIVLLKVFKRAGTLSAIADNMRSLDQLQPDWVVVEANMLFYRSIQEPILSKYLDVYRSLLKSDSIYQPYFPDRRPLVRRTDKTVDELRKGLIDTSEISSFRDLAVQ